MMDQMEHENPKLINLEELREEPNKPTHPIRAVLKLQSSEQILFDIDRQGDRITKIFQKQVEELVKGLKKSVITVAVETAEFKEFFEALNNQKLKISSICKKRQCPTPKKKRKSTNNELAQEKITEERTNPYSLRSKQYKLSLKEDNVDQDQPFTPYKSKGKKTTKAILNALKQKKLLNQFTDDRVSLPQQKMTLGEKFSFQERIKKLWEFAGKKISLKFTKNKRKSILQKQRTLSLSLMNQCFVLCLKYHHEAMEGSFKKLQLKLMTMLQGAEFFDEQVQLLTNQYSFQINEYQKLSWKSLRQQGLVSGIIYMDFFNVDPLLESHAFLIHQDSDKSIQVVFDPWTDYLRDFTGNEEILYTHLHSFAELVEVIQID